VKTRLKQGRDLVCLMDDEKKGKGEDERLTILSILRLTDDGKGKKGVAKKSIPKPYKFPIVHN